MVLKLVYVCRQCTRKCRTCTCILSLMLMSLMLLLMQLATVTTINHHYSHLLCPIGTEDAGSNPASPTRSYVTRLVWTSYVELVNRSEVRKVNPSGACGCALTKQCIVRTGFKSQRESSACPSAVRKICTVIDCTLPCRLGQKLTLQLVRQFQTVQNAGSRQVVFSQ